MDLKSIDVTIKSSILDKKFRWSFLCQVSSHSSAPLSVSPSDAMSSLILVSIQCIQRLAYFIWNVICVLLGTTAHA